MTTCEHNQARLNDFLDGTLPAAQAQELNAHLRQCSVCRTEYKALKATQELVRAVAVPDGQAARQRVMARFAQGAQAQTRVQPSAAQPLSAFWNRRGLALGLASVGACALLFVIRPGGGTSQPSDVYAGKPLMVVTALSSPSLPAASDLDAMTSLHAVQSFTVLNGDEELQQDALADANSRLNPPR